MSLKEDILAAAEALQSVPSVAVRMCCLLNDPEVSMNKVVETVRYDPALTARILQIANSAYYGGERQVGTLRDALVRLGLDRLYRVVFVSSVNPLLNRPLAGYSLEAGELWRHSVASALAAEIIDEDFSGGLSNGLAFTAGLLHDMGKLALGSLREDYFGTIKRRAVEERISFEVAERAVLGTDHTEVGSELLDRWGFPEEIVNAVRWHHAPECAAAGRCLTDTVHLADMVAMMMGMGLGCDELGYRASAGSLSRLGLQRENLEQVACRMLENLAEVDRIFGPAPVC